MVIRHPSSIVALLTLAWCHPQNSVELPSLKVYELKPKIVTTVPRYAAEATGNDIRLQPAVRMEDADEVPVCDDSLVLIDFGSRVLTCEEQVEGTGNNGRVLRKCMASPNRNLGHTDSSDKMVVKLELVDETDGALSICWKKQHLNCNGRYLMSDQPLAPHPLTHF